MSLLTVGLLYLYCMDQYYNYIEYLPCTQFRCVGKRGGYVDDSTTVQEVFGTHYNCNTCDGDLIEKCRVGWSLYSFSSMCCSYG